MSGPSHANPASSGGEVSDCLLGGGMIGTLRLHPSVQQLHVHVLCLIEPSLIAVQITSVVHSLEGRNILGAEHFHVSRQCADGNRLHHTSFT